MGIEIERKFLVKSDDWKKDVMRERPIKQGYLSDDPLSCVRVRVCGDQAYLTVKGKGDGVSRPEFEYEIPLADGDDMMKLCGGRTLTKRRHYVPAGDGLVWEIDVFSGRHEGLVLAEIELPSADASFETPDWLGDEVTHDPAYTNQNLASGKGLDPCFSASEKVCP